MTTLAPYHPAQLVLGSVVVCEELATKGRQMTFASLCHDAVAWAVETRDLLREIACDAAHGLAVVSGLHRCAQRAEGSHAGQARRPRSLPSQAGQHDMKTEWTLFLLALALFIAAFLGGCAAPVLPVASASLPQEHADRLARQVAAQIGGTTWRVAGTSMMPMLPDRCILVAEAVDFAELRAGDVVVYSNRHLRPIIHRLVERRGEGWRVKGDALAWPDDDLVTRTNFLGRQCAVFFTQ